MKNVKITLPKREIVVVHGDIEIEVEIKPHEFWSLKNELDFRKGAPLVKLIVKAKDLCTNYEASFTLTNLEIP